MPSVGTESETIDKALERLTEAHPVRVVRLRREPQDLESRGWDGEIILKTAEGTFRYVFEAKSHLRPPDVRHLRIQTAASRKRWDRVVGALLIADYVNPQLAHELRDAGINFVDTAGNLFLRAEPGLFLYVEGKKSPVTQKKRVTRLFQPSGLTMLFGLLLQPESVNHPYRHLAEKNGVALGTVGWVMRDLREQGFLERTGKGRARLARRKDLFDRWVEGYSSRLRPKVFLGEFRSPAADLDQVVKALDEYAVQQKINWGLTGGFAADELVHHYRGPTLTLFLETWKQSLQKELRWLSSEGGPITALRAFSPDVFSVRPTDTTYPVVHPLLVYAELLYGGTDRELETARLIYTRCLEPTLAKD